MKKSLKSILAITVSALMTTTLLAGCQKSGSQDSSASIAPSDSSTTTSVTKTAISVWGFGEEGNLLAQMKAPFEAENPDITLDIQSIPWDVADEKLTAAIAGKTGPDVIQMQTHTLMNYASAGALYPMNELVSSYPELALDNFFEFGKGLATYDDKQIAVPWYVDATVMFYRTDIFEEMGIAAPPTTWDELKDISKTLATRGEGKYGLGIGLANPVPGYAFILQAGADFAKDGKGTADSKEFADALAFYQSFFKEGLAPTNADVDLMQSFIDGSVPMTLQEPWVLNMLAENPTMAGKWATAPLPKKSTGMSYIGGSALVISQFSKNVDAAARFVAYMSKPETQVKWHEISKTLPANPTAWDADILKNNQALAAFGKQLNDGKTAPMIPNFMSMVVELSKAMEKINVGGVDPVQACAELNEAINGILGN